jgi:ribosomal protein S18 acetylase RimI-like enzyme
VQIMPRFFGWAPNRSELALRRSLAARDEQIYVVEDAGGVVRGLGHVELYDTPKGGGRRQVLRGHLDSLVVSSAFRRQGCGRALVEACARWARDQGAVQLVLTVWEGNAEAEAFYAALGYQRISQVLGIDL